jgi:hypothetical protein
MMRKHDWIGMPLAVGIGVAIAATAFAYPRFAEKTQKSCASCHTAVAGGVELTVAGKAFKADHDNVPATDVEGATYVGMARCRTCHAVEYKSWMTTSHAKALMTLNSASPKELTEIAGRLGVQLANASDRPEWCVSCHVTGHGEPGGYPGADSLKTAALSGVTCESCHGPGSKHVAAARAAKKDAINGKVGENYCRQCHTAEMSPKFEFAAYLAKGVHAKKAAE